MPDEKQQDGQICETILCEHLLRLGYYVFRPPAAQGPIDVIAISDAGEILLIDAKKDSRRVNPGRKKPDRIYRPRSEAQKRLGARIAYVDIESREVYIVPPIGKNVPHRNAC